MASSSSSSPSSSSAASPEVGTKRAAPDVDVAHRSFSLSFGGVSVGESRFDAKRAAQALERAVTGFWSEWRSSHDGSGPTVTLSLCVPLMSPFGAQVSKLVNKTDLTVRTGSVVDAGKSKGKDKDKDKDTDAAEGAFALAVGCVGNWAKPGENRDAVALYAAVNKGKSSFKELVTAQCPDTPVAEVGRAYALELAPGACALQARHVICVRGPNLNKDKPDFVGGDYSSNNAELLLEQAYAEMLRALAGLVEKELAAGSERERKRRNVARPGGWAATDVSALLPALQECGAAVGLGTLALGVEYPRGARPLRAEAVAVLHAFWDAGGRLVDTADTYGRDGDDLHYMEGVVREALASYADRAAADTVVVATKGGMDRRRGDASSRSWVMPHGLGAAQVKARIAKSHAALGGERAIALWQLHHAPSDVARLVTLMEAARESVDEGYVDRLGLCNVTLEQVRAVVDAGIPLASVQNEFGPLDLRCAKEGGKFGGVVAYCEQHGIAFLAIKTFGGTSYRRDEKAGVLHRKPGIVALAKAKGASPYALTLAWMRKRWPCVVPIPSASTIEHVRDSQSAKELELSLQEVTAIDAVFKAPASSST